MEMTDDKSDNGWADFDNALARVFAAVQGAAQSGHNPHFGSPYATLRDITNAVRSALTEEGFSWPQFIEPGADERSITVRTELRRRGLRISSSVQMKVGGRGTVQDVGSAITYARRYGLAAICGVYPNDGDDDDGNSASAPTDDIDRGRVARDLDAAVRKLAATVGESVESVKRRLVNKMPRGIHRPPTIQELRELTGIAQRMLVEDEDQGYES